VRYLIITLLALVLGGFIGRAIWGSEGVNGLNMGSIGLAVLGAVVLLALYRMFAGRSSKDYIDKGRRAA